MSTNLRIPFTYKRGREVLKELGPFCKAKADKVFIVGGKKALEAVQDRLKESLEAAVVEIVGIEWYGGECTWLNIEKMSRLAGEKKAELFIAVGGGKALDTGKAAAFKSKLPCITIPTIAATCAAFTPLSIIHDEHGVYVESTALAACPEGVFIDTDVIIQAPAKWLFAGMGDTLAKWYELRATTTKIPTTSWTLGGINNGKICYQVIKEFGPGAKTAMDQQKINEAFENVIDAIIFYAGMSSILGGEKCRGAAAHAVYFGFTNIPQAHAVGHGLLVGFGNLCLLALEHRRTEEILTEIKLAQDCGVPIKLADIADLSPQDLQTVSQVAAAVDEMKNMPFPVNTQMVLEAIEKIDRLSSENF